MGREVPPRGPPLTIVGRLLDRQPCPESAVRHYGSVMKYEVLEVLEGDYSRKHIYVVHGSPELPRDVYNKHSGTLQRFEIGGLHLLQLKEKLKENHSPFAIVVDPYPEVPGTRYLCLRVDPEN